jgi:hypothetical protein
VRGSWAQPTQARVRAQSHHGSERYSPSAVAPSPTARRSPVPRPETKAPAGAARRRFCPDGRA